MKPTCRSILLTLFIALAANGVVAQTPSHPHLFFDRAGMDLLQQQVLTNSRLFKIWEKFKAARVDSSINIRVWEGGITNLNHGRNYGDALGDLTIAYIVTRDELYAEKAVKMMTDLAQFSSWGHHLVNAHISLGVAFAWDVFYDRLSEDQKSIILNGVLAKADNHNPNDTYSNVNWTPAAGEGLIGLAFAGDGDASFNDFAASLLNFAKRNFKEKDRSVLWSHGSDGFPHEGLGYWRKYAHVGLFLKALRFNEPENDWFHLGKEYPGCEFLKNMAYPRIYADVQHPDLSTLTWSDSRQVRTRANEGPYGNLATLTLTASEYKDGYVMDFIDYLINETGVRFNGEDWATFLFYDDTDIPHASYRDLPLSRYWPDMEAAIFRSGWGKNDLVFYMRCGSPGGHGRRLKNLTPGGHDHPDANGFVLFYNNDYLAAEDGSYPNDGPEGGSGNKITYGHNTYLIDGIGQKGDLSTDVATTTANLDFLDADHVGYLLGDASDAYEGISKFHRSVIYKKHKYLIVLDELEDDQPHKYEFLLGADSRHHISFDGYNHFTIIPESGNGILPLVLVEPRNLSYAINAERPYSIKGGFTDMLRVWPQRDSTRAAFFALLYPLKTTDLGRHREAFYDGSRSGIVVDHDEYYLYNPQRELYTFKNLQTDASLCYFENSAANFEYLAAGAREFLIDGAIGFRSDEPLVAAFSPRRGKIRLGKNLGTKNQATITLFQPGIAGVLIDGELKTPESSGPGWVTFTLRPKQYRIGPSNAEQVVTDNYDVTILTEDFVRVVRPHGGERWPAGSTQVINWVFAGSFSSVNIDYSTDAGQSWKNIAAGAPNTGAFQWLVAADASPRALIRVANSETGVPNDVSDTPFVIYSPTPPVIHSFQPNSGPIGTAVTVTGRHFVGAHAVLFGRTLAANFIVHSDSVITAAVPANVESGPVAVAKGEETATSTEIFTVMLPPMISSFSPERGLAGSVVTIAGGRFIGVTRVMFNAAPAERFEVLSESEIRAVVPAAAASGKIKVVAESGTSESAQDFVVVPPTLSFIPIDDSYVMSSDPSEVRGLTNQLRVRSHPSNVVFSFLKFQVSGLAGVVQSAKLLLRVNLASRSGGSIYSVSNFYRDGSSAWEEEALNWENAPAIDGSPLSAVDSVALEEVVEFDVSAAIAGDGVYSFGIKSSLVDLVRYDSKESAFPPRLVIDLTAHPPTQAAISLTSPSKTPSPTLDSPLPQEIFLKPNYPNPFNNETVIEYGLPVAGRVKLVVYNLIGQVVRTLVDDHQPAGFKRAQWDGRDNQGWQVSSGIYFIRLEAGSQKLIRKVLLQK